MTVLLYQDCIRGQTFYYPQNEIGKLIISLMKSTSGKRVAFKDDEVETLRKIGFDVQIKKPKVVYEF